MWEWEEPEQQQEDPRERIIALAERFARKEGFASAWTNYNRYPNFIQKISQHTQYNMSPYRVNAATIPIMETNDPAARRAAQPTPEAVCDFALVLAIDEGVEDEAKLASLRRPENPPAPDGGTQPYGWAAKYKEKARIALAERMAPGELEILYESPPNPFQEQPRKREKKNKYPPAPVPTWEEVVEFAKVLAMDEGNMNRNFLRLIRWTSGERLKMTGKTFARHFHAAMAYRDRARQLLTERMALDHLWHMRRLRREALWKKQRARRRTIRLFRQKSQTPPPCRQPFLSGAVRPRAPDPPPTEPIRLEEVSGKYHKRRIRETILIHAGGGQRPGALRQRSLWNPLPQCNAPLLDNRRVHTGPPPCGGNRPCGASPPLRGSRARSNSQQTLFLSCKCFFSLAHSINYKK